VEGAAAGRRTGFGHFLRPGGGRKDPMTWTLRATVGRNAVNLPSDVKVVQILLNRVQPRYLSLLRVDGCAVHRTLCAIDVFQREVLELEAPDGVVAPDSPTFDALCGRNARSSVALAWGAKVEPAFKYKVIAICLKLDMSPDFLMAAMALETGATFDPAVPNAAGSGAVGLIQFMPATAKALGTSTAALKAMTAVAQLDYVEKYFKPKAGTLHSIEDVYMAILYPAAIGHAPGDTLFEPGTKAYKQNKGFDANKDGRISIGEVAATIRTRYNLGIAPGRLG
jgi:hypothetical protein